jgi:phosphomannomutase
MKLLKSFIQIRYYSFKITFNMKISISGVRGIYGEDLNLHEIVRFGRLFGSFLTKKKNRKCLTARDTRVSGRILLQVLSASLMEQGVDVYDLGMAPTPILFREARRYGAGIVVTASHNPVEWNGLKFVTEGRGIYEEELNGILQGAPSKQNKFGTTYTIKSGYIDDLYNLISISNVPKNVALGFDLGGGAACGQIENLFNKLNYRFLCINDTPGISSRTPDPTSDGLSELRFLVRENKLDFGFAFDLDGDRLVMVNSSGQKQTPDSTLLLCVASALKSGMKKFVTSLDTSVCVKKLIDSHNGCTEYSKVGEANVVQKMLEVGADAGGEGSSGGFILPKFNMCRDGILAATIISSLDRASINEFMAAASEYSQIRSKIRINSSNHRETLDRLLEVLELESSHVITLDGIKAILDENSWILVRTSNTEQVLRISVESKANKTEALHNWIMEKVKRVSEHVN